MFTLALHHMHYTSTKLTHSQLSKRIEVHVPLQEYKPPAGYTTGAQGIVGMRDGKISMNIINNVL